MAHDPVHQLQMTLRRGGQLLRRRGVLAGVDDARQHLEGEARDRFFAAGERQVAKLAREIEQQTGATLEGRRALDYGCGVGRLALPLAGRCEFVYGLDVAPPMLEAAERNAALMEIENVQWLASEHLAELAGSYDLVLSVLVFQHIPSREGEQIFSTLVQGLRPGGVGAIHVTLRPGFNPLSLRSWALPNAYLMMNSYSLNRLGRLLAEADVSEWQVKWHTSITPEAPRTAGEENGNGTRENGAGERRPYPSGTIVFRKN